MWATPHSANADTVRFCDQAASRTVPAHASAKLCITISVDRSSCMIPFFRRLRVGAHATMTRADQIPPFIEVVREYLVLS
jgi:hypothetical protein